MMAIHIRRLFQALARRMIPSLGKWPRILPACGLFCVAMAFALPAQAVMHCTFTPMGGTTINFSSITVPRDAAVGSVLGSLQTTVNVNCPPNPDTPNSGFYLQFTTSQALGSPTGTWTTGVAGVGLKVTSVDYTGVSWALNSQYPPPLGGTGFGPFASAITDGNASSGNVVFTFQLIKTAATVASGPFTVGQIMTLVTHDVPGNNTPVAGQVSLALAGSVNASTCLVTSNPTVVTLPAVPVSQLAISGATAGAKNFTVALDCTGAIGNLYATLTDATMASNRTDQLNLAAGSSATNVKLQILYNNVPIEYGADSASSGNLNQWLVGPASGTSGIPLTARYIATGAVGPGIVKGNATFTLSYQ